MFNANLIEPEEFQFYYVCMSDGEDQAVALGIFLKKSRLKADLSQTDVAKRLKLATPQCVSNWETGRQSPPMMHLAAICDLYDVELEPLFDLLVDYSLEQTKKRMQVHFKKIKKAR